MIEDKRSGTDAMDWEHDLNPRQLEAVRHEHGPLLVLAGPGSGKTRVLTHRIAYLIRERKVPPFSILAITFTNKAADEMRQRVLGLLQSESRDIWIGTFHATCSRILRRHIDRLGFQANFVIYDEADQTRVIKACLGRLGISDKTIQPSLIRSLLDLAKNQCRHPSELASGEGIQPEVLRAVVADYEQTLKRDNALDFGDLIQFVLRLFDGFPDVLQSFRRRFSFVLVDEYQDTNKAQHELLKRLVPEGGDICAVGDDDQSIYRWRGAEVENMLFFQRDFPGTHVVTLEQNYRSTANILKAAEGVARRNSVRLEKHLWTQNHAGDPIFSLVAETPEAEANFVATEIGSLVGNNDFSCGDMGVFFRTNAQSRPFEERLLAHGIPYVVIGSLRFYERAEVKDCTAYLRLLYNLNDSASLSRILNCPPRGIGDVTENQLTDYAAQTGTSLWQAMEHGLTTSFWKGPTAKKFESFRDLILDLRRSLEGPAGLCGLLKELLRRTGYPAYLKGFPEGDRRVENVEELVRTAKNFDDEHPDASPSERLEAFCERISLITNADTTSSRGRCVSLMTLHCAKGLEFPVVFLTGMEDGLMPHTRSSLSNDGLSEERRLCYVGMTRAKVRLYLSRVNVRALYGEYKIARPSPFLRSIPANLVHNIEGVRTAFEATLPNRRQAPWMKAQEGYRSGGADFPDLSPPSDSDRAARHRIGDRVQHESLGRGTVRQVENAGAREKITVQFDNGRIRKLMAHGAPIEKIPS